MILHLLRHEPHSTYPITLCCASTSDDTAMPLPNAWTEYPYFLLDQPSCVPTSECDDKHLPKTLLNYGSTHQTLALILKSVKIPLYRFAEIRSKAKIRGLKAFVDDIQQVWKRKNKSTVGIP